MAFVKLDVAILTSSVWADRDARDVFLAALLLAVPRELGEGLEEIETRALRPTGWTVPAGWYGFVEAAGVGIVRAAGVPLEAGLAALERLAAPDPDSRSPEHDGRRLVRVAGGYVVLNFDRYREKDHTAAERSKRYRDRKRHGASRRDDVTEPGSVTPETVTPRRDATPAPPPVTASRRGVTAEDRSVTQAEAEAEAYVGPPDLVAPARATSTAGPPVSLVSPPVLPEDCPYLDAARAIRRAYGRAQRRGAPFAQLESSAFVSYSDQKRLRDGWPGVVAAAVAEGRAPLDLVEERLAAFLASSARATWILWLLDPTARPRSRGSAEAAPHAAFDDADDSDAGVARAVGAAE